VAEVGASSLPRASGVPLRPPVPPLAARLPAAGAERETVAAGGWGERGWLQLGGMERVRVSGGWRSWLQLGGRDGAGAGEWGAGVRNG